MTQITPVKGDIIIADGVNDAHRGQVYGTILIGNKKTLDTYGVLDYSIYGDDFLIHMIEVKPQYQRKGYATMMLDYIKKEYKGYKIKGFGNFATESGKGLAKSRKVG